MCGYADLQMKFNNSQICTFADLHIIKSRPEGYPTKANFFKPSSGAYAVKGEKIESKWQTLKILQNN